MMRQKNNDYLVVVQNDYTVMIYENNRSIGYLTEYFSSMDDAMMYAKSITSKIETEWENETICITFG